MRKFRYAKPNVTAEGPINFLAPLDTCPVREFNWHSVMDEPAPPKSCGSNAGRYCKEPSQPD